MKKNMLLNIIILILMELYLIIHTYLIKIINYNYKIEILFYNYKKH